MNKNAAKQLAELGAVAALYVITGKLGFLMAIPPGNVTAVWPPSGVALAAALLLGSRASYAGIWLGSFFVNSLFFSNITNPFSPAALAVSFSIGVGSTLQAYMGAFLIRRFIQSIKPLDRPQDVFKFVGIELFICMTAASVGVTSLCLSGFSRWTDYAYTWWTWWLGDTTGVIIVAPFLLNWSTRPRIRWEPWRLAEAALLLVPLLITSLIVFRWHSPLGVAPYPTEYALIPFLMWAALRFGHRGVTLLTIAVSGIAIWGTLTGLGPFARGTRNESLLLLQGFASTITVTGLVLAAAIAEYKRAEEALHKAHNDLERRVQERTLQLTQAAKLESVGRLAAGVAHEVKNPLAIILQSLAYLSRSFDGSGDSNVPLILNYAKDAVYRADSVIRGVLDFATQKDLQMRLGRINPVIEQALLLVKHELDKSHIRVVKEGGPSPPFTRLDPNKMEQVFVNIFLNAIQAMPDGGTLTVRTRMKELVGNNGGAGHRRTDHFEPGEWAVIIEVEDTGTGISQEILPKIFDPFFTTKPTGKGTGLGLTVTLNIIEMHGGSIEVRNREQGGTIVTVMLKTTERAAHVQAHV